MVLGVMPPARPAHAATITVNSLADSGGTCVGAAQCTLRTALSVAAAGDTIKLGVTGTIALASQLTVTKNVTIEGPTTGSLDVSGQNTVRVFVVNSGVQASFTGITIRNGSANTGGGLSVSSGATATLTNVTIRDSTGTSVGGGIYANASTVRLTRSTLSFNTTPNGGGAIFNDGGTVFVTESMLDNNSAELGGGIYSQGGMLTVTGSTMSNNEVNPGPGASVTADGGALQLANATVTVTNSTFTGNRAEAGVGGAISNVGSTVTVTFSTFSSNRARNGGGGAIWNGFSGSSLSLRNSIVVDSATGGNCAGITSITSLGNNLSDSRVCFPGGSKGDLLTFTPLLSSLRDNSPGATMTQALLPGSPAIDGVTFEPTDCGGSGPGAVTTDQRGVPRPQGREGVRCDIGAYELVGGGSPTISAVADQTTNEDTATPPIPFTIGDPDTSAGNLVVTASSSDQSVVPSANVVLGGSGANRTVKVTPAANQNGASTIDLAVTDGVSTVHETFTLTVTPVNDAPMAANDFFAVAAGQTLTVPAGSGVLANDADLEGTALSATVATGPAHGSLELGSGGGLTYTPATGFVGTDTFTYRASDGDKSSAPATVSIVVTTTECVPRPRVVARPVAGDGRLQVHVEATPRNGQQTNALQQVVVDRLDNARVIQNGQVLVSAQKLSVPRGVVSVDFAVERMTPGQPAMVYLTVEDGCGTWKTFVGGGTAAGF
jgi:hypothetical protein